MQEEIWKQVIGYECLFEVSNLGRVKSLSRVVVCGKGSRIKPEKIMNPTISGKKKYLEVNLFGSIYRVHRLVCLAFHGPQPDGMECCHNDGNRVNNHESNLRWGTRMENILDAKSHGTFIQGETVGGCKLKAEDVVWMRTNKGLMSVQKMANKFGVSYSTAKDALTGRNWKHITALAALTGK